MTIARVQLPYNLRCTISLVIDLTDALHAHDASIATTMNSTACNTATAAAQTGNASVLRVLVAKTAPNRCAARWQTVKTDHRGRETSATAKTAGKESTAMFVLITEPAMR